MGMPISLIAIFKHWDFRRQKRSGLSSRPVRPNSSKTSGAMSKSRAPVALFGFSYCLERMAVGRDDAFIQTVEAICPPKCRAFRFLKVHSNVGSDHGHVDEQLAFFESLAGSDLIPITCAAYETAGLLARQPLMDRALTDEEIGRRFEEAGIDQSFLEHPKRGAK